MPRAELSFLVTTSVGSTIKVVDGATVTVRRASDDTLATLYESALESTEVGNPLVADDFGKVSAWVEMDKYVLVIEGTNLTSYSEYWDAIPADHIAAYGKGYVFFDIDGETERPSGFVSIEWVGSVPPANALFRDTWINTDGIGVLANSFVLTEGEIAGHWPDRPGGSDGLAVVLWIGGIDPDDDPADLMEPNDQWFPTVV